MPRFRPLGSGDVFDEAFELYKKNFHFLLLIALAILVPVRLLGPFMALLFPGTPTLAQFGTDLVSPGFGSTLRGLGPIFTDPAFVVWVYPVGTAVLAVALSAATSDRYLGNVRTMREIFSSTFRQIVPLTVTALLVCLLLMLGMIFCYVGIIVPLTLLVFSGQTFALEHKRYTGTLRRSKQLVSGYGGRMFGILCLLWLLSFVIELAIEMPIAYVFGLIAHATPASNMLFTRADPATAVGMQRIVISQVSSAVSGLLLTPFVYCVLTVSYYDLRVRKEAFDIDLLAQGLTYPPLITLKDYLPPAIPIPMAPEPKVKVKVTK